MIKIYKNIALIVFNAILVLLLVNLICWAYLKITFEEQNVSVLYDIINYQAFQPEEGEYYIDSGMVVKRLDDYIGFLKSGGKEFEYHPATEFQLAPYITEYINIEKRADGFNIRQAPSLKEQNFTKEIYCFGGSTTFGPFVDNTETWPWFLEQATDSVTVVNFGVPGFVPTQETSQFIYLLKSGYRPSLCIFLDGVNIGPQYDGSDFTRSIYQKFDENYNKIGFNSFLAELPCARLLQNRPLKDPVDIFKTNNIDFAEIELGDEYNEYIANRFIENALIRQQIADLYGVKIVQFLQPNASLDYPIELHSAFSKRYADGYEGQNLQKNYAYIYEKIKSSNCGYIDLSYLFEKYSQPAIIDIVHYSPGFNQFLAEELISQYVNVDSLDQFDYLVNKSTGEAFYLRELYEENE